MLSSASSTPSGAARPTRTEPEVEPRTPSERDDLRETIAIKRRMEERKLREARVRAAPGYQRAGRRTSSTQVIISPSGMAHLATTAGGLQPICVHYVKGVTDGWRVDEGAWDALPHDIERCRDCIALA